LALTNCPYRQQARDADPVQKKDKDTAVTVVASDPKTDRCIIAARTHFLKKGLAPDPDRGAVFALF